MITAKTRSREEVTLPENRLRYEQIAFKSQSKVKRKSIKYIECTEKA